MTTPPAAFVRYLADLPDPRVDRTEKHALADILVIATCAVICGADTFEQVERFGKARQGWLKRFLGLPAGIPSHDTFNRVFAALDREKFAAGFARWTADLTVATGLRAIAIDGKACRAAPGDTFSGCLHLVTAWAVENHLFLGQAAVADGSHEIAAVPELLRVLDLTGALVTMDAAGRQKATLKQLRDQGGDYLVAVKGNQPALRKAVHAAFDRAAAAGFAGCDMHEAVEDGHGRHEERYVTVIRDPGGLPADWAGVGAVVMVGREREVGGANTSTAHFYLTSLRVAAGVLAGYVRGHWGIENGLHWCLDVSFREDANRTRDTDAGSNLGVVRRVAAGLLKQDPEAGSIQTRRLNAALDERYLERALQGFQAD
jgi:predicted transposase YbfD/YdcC